MKKCAVFCSQGLGDGLLFLIISNNLSQQGYEVTTFHRSLSEMQGWFGKLRIEKYPDIEQIKSILASSDLIIINADHINAEIKRIAQESFPQKTIVLQPTTCKKGFKGTFCLNKNRSMVKNLLDFSVSNLDLKEATDSNGITPLKDKIYRKNKARVIIHPTSADVQKNWPAHKFLKLALRLRKKGFDPVFVLSPVEKSRWQGLKDHQFEILNTPTLDDLAEHIYQSGFMIGNDSGVGHLASCLKIPTLTIFSSKRKQLLWKPDWFINASVTPWPLLPNIKGFRWKDKKWHYLVDGYRVLRAFYFLKKQVDDE